MALPCRLLQWLVSLSAASCFAPSLCPLTVVRVQLLPCRLQERLEAQEGRYAVRRQPLGSDRFNRCYWWGLAGNKEALLLQQEVGAPAATLELLATAARDAAAAAAAGPSAADMMLSVFAGAGGSSGLRAAAPGSAGRACSTADTAEGGQAGSSAAGGAQQQRRMSAAGGGVLDHAGLQLARGPEGWGLLDQPDQVEALMGSCEVRGVREKELKANLDKVRGEAAAGGVWWWWVGGCV